jgi:CRISPR-associated protein Csb1
MSTLPTPSLSTLRSVVRDAVAIRVELRLQPAGGAGAKVFPPTYGPAQDGKDDKRFGESKYALETRRIGGQDLPCVLLDSVASQANRVEVALRDGWESADLPFPLVRVDFSHGDLIDPIGVITALDAPHRIYDAILRDSVDAGGVLFRHTPAGKAVTAASPRDATALFAMCPTALVFGAWDSTGPKGGMGSKFPRAISSEIVGVNIRQGTKVASRLDPLAVTKVPNVVYKVDGPEGWTTTAPVGKDGKAAASAAPSEINHGNVTPSRDVAGGGVTFDHAQQTTVLSLPALRRLKFPTDVDGGAHPDRAAAELAARTALTALALNGLARCHAEGHDLRSGTLLVGEGPFTLQVIYGDGRPPEAYGLDVATADALLGEAAADAAAHGMAWQRDPIPTLKPAPKLLHLLRESQKAQLTTPAAEGA